MSVIGITGGTGFVGRHVAALLSQTGYRVVIFSTRHMEQSGNQPVTYSFWNPALKIIDQDALAQVDAMIHLAGAGVADKRWSEARKKEIVNSRVPATEFLVRELVEHAPRCKTFVGASAIGIYGPDRGEKPFMETDVAWNDFLGTTCQAWERASLGASTHFRTVVFRFGIVLGREAGAFPKFEEPTRMGIYPVLGSGRQVVSWIEVHDLARMILFALEQENITGIYNAVAPHPVTQTELMHAIAQAKKGIHFFAPTPAFLIRAMLGEMSVEILKSCTVSAGKILESGFAFQFDNVESAVKGILSK